jgi:3-isopropylmalate dehydratase small subunit
MEEARGGNHLFSIDLAAQTVIAPSGRSFAFDVDSRAKARLATGLDTIGETLEAVADIDRFEARQALQQPWLA